MITIYSISTVHNPHDQGTLFDLLAANASAALEMTAGFLAIEHSLARQALVELSGREA